MKNEIFVHTEKGSYVGGEWIYGTVYLCISSPIKARAVRFEIRGYEKGWWRDSRTEHYQENGVQKTRTITVDRHADHAFFKDSVDLTTYPGGFPVGQFSYPFQYRLPDTLPGVFRISGSDYKAKVEYKIKALVDIPGFFSKDLVCKQHIVIHEKLDKAIQPRHFVKNHQVRTLCCIPRGEIKCEAYMDKNCYMSGETAQVHVNVDNQSSVEVSHFNTKLIRELNLTSKCGHHKTIRDVISVTKYAGTEEKSQKKSDCPLPLHQNGHYVQPSTNGRYVRCRYDVLIELDIPWAPDLEIYAPVVMYAPQNQQWATWQAPAWTTQAVPQQVIPQFAYNGPAITMNLPSVHLSPGPAVSVAPPVVLHSGPVVSSAPPMDDVNTYSKSGQYGGDGNGPHVSYAVSGNVDPNSAQVSFDPTKMGDFVNGGYASGPTMEVNYGENQKLLD